MAGEDIIIKALVQAGLELNDRDIAALESRLANVGKALGKGGEESFKAMQARATQLMALRTKLEKDLARVRDAATRGDSLEAMSPGDQRELTKSYNRVKAYQDQVKKLTGQLSGLGDSTGIPVFRQLNSLNAKFAEFGALMRQVAPQIDNVTRAQKANALALKKQAADERQRNAQQIRAQVIDRGRATNKLTNKAGAEAFFRGSQDGFLSLSKTSEAKAAKAFGQAEVALRERAWKLIGESTGFDSKQTKLAAKDLDVAAKAVDRLNGRLAALADADKLAAKNQTKADRLAKTERVVAQSRQNRSKTERDGAAAFAAAGGINGDVAGFASSDKAAKAMKFAKGELDDMLRLQTALTDAYGAGSKQVKELAKDTAAYGNYVGRLNPQIDALKDAEAKAKVREREAKQEARAVVTQAEREDARRESRKIRMQELERTRTIANQLDGGAGRAAYRSGYSNDFTTLKLQDAEAAERFAKGELDARVAIEKATRKALGATHEETLRAQAEVDRLTAAYSRLINRVNDLKLSASGVDKDRVVAETFNKKRDLIADSRAQRAATDVYGKAALDQAGGALVTDVSKITGLQEAKAALGFLKGEYRDTRAEAAALTDAFGAGDAAARRVTSQVDLQADGIAKLEAHIRTLTDAQEKQTAAQRIATIRNDSATARASNKQAYTLMDQGFADPQSLTNLKDVKSALAAGTAELGKMQSIQKILGTTAGEASTEYKQMTAEIHRAAEALNLLRLREGDLNAEIALARENAKKDPMRSNIYGDGKAAYAANRSSVGGLESLRGNERDQARSYVQARLAESRRQYDILSRTMPATSPQVTAAAAAVREYEENLRRLNGTGAKTNEMMHGLGSAFKTFLKYAIIYQAMYQVVGAFAALARSVVNLQTEMLEIQAVTGSTVEQMQMLGSSVASVAQGSKFSLSELTKAAKTLAQAGVPLEDLNSTLQATANFAAATGSNLDTAADLISTTRDVFKELNDDVIANQLAKAINISKLTGEDLKTILSLGAQTAQSFNLTAEQFLGAVATLRNAGLKASTVATGLRQGMLEIFTPDNVLTKALQTRYKALGEDMGEAAVKARFFAFTRSRAPMVAALTELKRLGFNDEGQMGLSRAFDIRSSNAIKAMIANLSELSRNESRITFGRAAAEGARITVEGLNASWTRLGSTINSFTYNRSTGFLGFLEEMVKGLDKSLQTLDLVLLRRQALGNLPPLGPDGQPQAEDKEMGFLSNPERRADLTRQQSKISIEDANEMARARDMLAQQEQAEREEIDRSADVWDIDKAQRGVTTGTAAAHMVSAAQQLVELEALTNQLFGPELAADTAKVREIVESYTSLAPQQRSQRIEKLRAEIPALKDFTNQQIEDAYYQLLQLETSFNGTFDAMREELMTRVSEAGKIINKLDQEGRSPATPAEFEAAALAAIYAQDEALQEIILGTSTLGADFQLGILQQTSQKFADRLRQRDDVANVDKIVDVKVGALVLKIKAIAAGASKETQAPQVRSQVNALLTQFGDVDKATIGYLNQIYTSLQDVAQAARTARERGLFQVGAGEVKKLIESKEGLITTAGAERVAFARETVVPRLQDKGFQEYWNSMPFDTPNKAFVTDAIKSGAVNEADFRDNTAGAKALTEAVTAYNDMKLQQKKTEDEVAATTGKLLDLESQARRSREAYNTSRTNKDTSQSLADLRANTSAEAALVQYEIDEAESSMTRGVTAEDRDKNKGLIERRLRAQKRLSELYEDQAKEEARILRDQLKFDLDARKQTATRDRDEAAGILRNADGNTPTQVIDDARQKYNVAVDELMAVLKETKDSKGDFNQLTDAQFEAEKQKLRHYEELADSLELAHRREATLRDKLNDQLEALVQTSGDPATDARMREAGMEVGSRAQRNTFYQRRATLLTGQVALATSSNAKDAERYARNAALIGEGKGTSEMLEEQRKLESAMRSRQSDVRAWGDEIEDLKLRSVNASQTIHGALQQAFDIDMIRIGLEQSGSSVEGLAVRIHDSLIAGIEGIGDAFADALLEGEDFFDSLDKLFADTGKQILRDVIKTYTTESVTGFLKGLTPAGRAEKGATPNPNGDGIGGLVKAGADLVKDGWNWLTGSGGQHTPALDDGEGNGVAGLISQVGPAGEVIKTVGGGLRPDEMGDLGAVAGMLGMGGAEGGGAGGKKAGDCCCDDGLEDLDISGTGPLEEALTGGKPAGDGVLAEVAEGEGKGFFASIKDGFFGLIDGLKGGFGGMLQGLGGLLGLGGSGAAGGLGMLTAVLGFKNGGLIKAATGGIITGPGTGTSDSVPGFIRSRSGKLKPLLTSNGESILNARATSFLGADGVHALNAGQFVKANTSSMRGEISSMMRGMKAGSVGAGAAAPRAPIKETRTTQLHVTPAAMRMRMGDWLEQHVIEELSKR